MKIFISRNLSKNASMHIQGESLDIDTFKKLATAILEGITCYLNEKRIETDIKGAPKFGYEITECTLEELPEQLLAHLQAQTKVLGSFSKALYAYNQGIKGQIENYIKRRSKYVQNLELRNQAYRDIMTAAMKQGIDATSPCLRTKYEVVAELKFLDSLPTDDDISDQDIAFVKRFAPAFGLDIPELKFYVASREVRQYLFDEEGNPLGHYELKLGHNWSELYEGKRIDEIADFKQQYKSHGRTEEIQRVYTTKENYFRVDKMTNKAEKDYAQAYHPDNLPEDFMVHNNGTTRAMYKEVLTQLRWFLSLPETEQDNFIAEGYVRCPHCGQITRLVNDDVLASCEFCDGIIEELDGLDLSNGSNDLLFYGTDISDSYSDLSEVRSYIEDVEEV